MEYTTQMDAARKGIVTPQMATVAEKEKCLLKNSWNLLLPARLRFLLTNFIRL